MDQFAPERMQPGMPPQGAPPMGAPPPGDPSMMGAPGMMPPPPGPPPNPVPENPFTGIVAMLRGVAENQGIEAAQEIYNFLPPSILEGIKKGVQNDYDALEFISMVRARHQAEDLAAGVDPDNSIDPEKLSEFERKSLRDAFLILGNAQKFLKYRYQPGRAN